LRAVWGDARWAANAAARKHDEQTSGIKAQAAALTELDIRRVLPVIVWGGSGHGDVPTSRKVQWTLLCDIFGPPPVSLDPAWLAWNGGTVPAIARRVYDDRAFHDLPILADALEDAGCADPDVLAHCRGGGEHVRGCWVVDLILGKT
jgi:hypothetical protein